MSLPALCRALLLLIVIGVGACSEREAAGPGEADMARRLGDGAAPDASVEDVRRWDVLDLDAAPVPLLDAEPSRPEVAAPSPDVGPPDVAPPPACEAGDRICMGVDLPGVCEPGGGLRALEACGGDQVCVRGDCVPPACAEAAETRSYLGCEYWAVDLPTQRYDGPGQANPEAPLGLVVANADREQPVQITLYGPDGTPGTFVRVIDMLPPQGDPQIPDRYPAVHLRSVMRDATGVVLPGSFERAEDLEIPPGGVATMLIPHTAVGNQLSEVTRSAWRLTSTAPVAAYQFSPYCCNYSFSNDASLLLPRTALGEAYRFVGVPTQGGLPQALTVVATTDGTDVTVTLPPGGRALPDPTERLTFVDGVAQVRLDAHEVLSVQAQIGAATPRGRDLSGATVRASAPVAVFSSHQCARYPDYLPNCDHLEEQLFPPVAWGRSFVLAPAIMRGDPVVPSEVTYWKLAADHDETLVVLSVPYDTLSALDTGTTNGFPCVDRLVDDRTIALQAGEFCEFGTQQALSLESSKPLMVAGILVGQGATGIESPYGTHAGDPSLFLVPPARQYRRDYSFIVPGTYVNQYVTVMTEPGAELTLDGAPIDLTEAMSVSGSPQIYRHVRLRDGVHHVSGDRPFGILVVAFDDFVSFAFTGGLNLQKE